MGVTGRIAVGLYVVVGLMFVAMGVLYLSTPEFMSYHAEAAGASWSELGSRLQGLILGYLKLSGAGGIAAGAAVLVLTLLPFRAGEGWSRWAVPLVALAYLLPASHATRTVIERTGASPPIDILYAELALVAVAAALSVRAFRPGGGSRGDSR